MPLHVPADNRKWVTCTDQFTRRRRDMLLVLIATHLGTYHLLFFPGPVTVYRITAGERDVFLGANGSVTD